MPAFDFIESELVMIDHKSTTSTSVLAMVEAYREWGMAQSIHRVKVSRNSQLLQQLTVALKTKNLTPINGIVQGINVTSVQFT